VASEYGAFGTQIAFRTIPPPESAYFVPACAHVLPNEGDGTCSTTPALNLWDRPGPPGAVKRPWRFPMYIGPLWRFCMGARGA
jgi:hypothetical protein